MRVLWFTNVPLADPDNRPGAPATGGGHWMSELLRHASARSDLEFCVVTAFAGSRETRFQKDNVSYHLVCQPRRCGAFAARKRDMERCAAIVNEFAPDLIHIHGSERFYGMLKAGGTLRVPTLVSIQGLLGPYASLRHFLGALTPAEAFRSVRFVELLAGVGLAWRFYHIRNAAKRERKILRAVEGFLGRTDWDRAHTKSHNPSAAYYHVDEILRPSFYQSRWALESCDRYTVVYTNWGDPRRGTENLLRAIGLLKTEFPEIRLRLGGGVSKRSGYGRFFHRMIAKLGIADRVDLLGRLDERAMVSSLLRSHVFAITSYIENSPNSLAEAMAVGMPCVASFVGGIPNMVTADVSGLLYPVEEVPLLAEQIRRIFLDDQTAVRLGNNARRAALVRHDPQAVVDQLFSAYEGLLSERGRQ